MVAVSGSHGHGGHGHDHGVSAAGRAGARHQRAAARVVLPDRRLPGRAGRRRHRHRLPGPAVRRRPHGHRRARPRDGPGRHPRRLAPRAPTRSAPSGSTGWRSSPRSPTPSSCSASPPTCSSRRSIRLGEDREIASLPVLVVGVLGLAVNIVAFLLLRQGAKESLNVEGAYLEVLSDTLGSLGVIVAAIVWGVTGWTWVDPVIGAAIGALHPAPRLAARPARRCASWCRPRRRASTCRRCGPTWPPSPAWSTSTTCTSGRSPPTWRWPRPT